MPRVYKSYPLDRPCGSCGETDPKKFGFILGKYRKNICRKCAYKYKMAHIKKYPERYKKAQRDYYKRNKERILENNKRWKYGTTFEELKELRKKYKCCPICGRKKKLVVDHNHKTKAIRGLICTNCNSLLGHCRDNIAVLKRAVLYLK